VESTGKHHTNPEGAPDLGAIASDVASLKRDFAALANHLKDGTVSGASDAVGQVGDEARRLYGNVAEQGQRSIKAFSRQVEGQPVLSLLIAFAAGFIGSQLLSRSR
jgi:ElaB/YqjD/DUF883 family membrane-anchored ribosome-binding protein